MTEVDKRFCERCGAPGRADATQCEVCSSPFLPKHILKERYRFLEVVGQGGMGLVYKAEDLTLKRAVAIKTIRLPQQPSSEALRQASTAFEREALLLAGLSHPHLPHIYDHFEERGSWYLIMQFIPGETLSTRLKNSPDGALPVDEVLDLGMKLCTVLSYLHSHNPPIIFSDLKPDNIMLTPQGDLYLIDFGIARLLQPFQEDERKFVSHGYSAPEQFEHTALTPRADIYSLGATLYRMLSGRHPAIDAFSLLSSEASPQVSPQLSALNQLIKTMVAQREEERPLTISVVRQEIQHILVKVTNIPYKVIRDSYLDGRNYTSNTNNKDNTQLSSRTYEDQEKVDTYKIEVSDVNEVVESTQRIHYPDFQVRCAAWSPNGKFIAVADVDGNIQLWLWSSGYRNLLSDDDDAVVVQKWSLLHQPNVTGIVDQTQIAAYDRAIGPTSGPTKTSLTWSPDGVYLAATFSLFRPGSIFVLDTLTGDFSLPYQGHGNGIRDIIWSPDGALIASIDWSSGIHIWNAKKA